MHMGIRWCPKLNQGGSIRDKTEVCMTNKSALPDPSDFAHVTEWVFDLDNTLYPRHIDLFSQIDKKMTAYVRELLGLDHDAARGIQKKYYREHGTTLKGLMLNHGIEPNDFLEKVHDIDYSWVKPDPELAQAIKALPGRKFIFTNGDTPHAERTAQALGILDHFDDIFDIIAADLSRSRRSSSRCCRSTRSRSTRSRSTRVRLAALRAFRKYF